MSDIGNLTKKIQDKELEMLLYFQKICDEHHLTFYLCGGGLIGAIRHRGFIPWDDDLDVFMPRPDYEKLSAIWNEYADTQKYSYCRTT
ncbi:MAG: LicD family protein, partial [Clostridium sp.]|nr:LicD family protein [Clostridium sp.]